MLTCLSWVSEEGWLHRITMRNFGSYMKRIINLVSKFGYVQKHWITFLSSAYVYFTRAWNGPYNKNLQIWICGVCGSKKINFFFPVTHHMLFIYFTFMHFYILHMLWIFLKICQIKAKIMMFFILDLTVLLIPTEFNLEFTSCKR